MRQFISILQLVPLLSILLAQPVVSDRDLFGIAAPKFIANRPDASFQIDESADFEELESAWRAHPRTTRKSKSDKKTKWSWRPCKNGKSTKSGKGKSGKKSSKGTNSYCDEDPEQGGVDGNNGGLENGANGQDGANGENGENGMDGTGGTNGENGMDGTDGTNGENGMDGTDGTNGENGTDGTDGTNGETGENIGQGSSPGGDGISYPWPVPDDPTNDVTNPDDATCEAIGEQGPIPDLAENEVRSELSAMLDISYDFPPYLRDGVATELRKISPVIALWVAGCESQAQSLADTLIGGRRLEETLDISYVSLSTNPSGTAPTCSEGNSCQDSFRADFRINHDEGISESLLRQRIIEAFQVFADLLNLISRGAIILNTDNIDVQNTNNFGSVVRGADEAAEDPMNVAAVIGITAGGLAFILLLVLLIRRRQAEDEVSHLKLEEDDDFIREIETASSGPSGDENYESRNVHVVGEADSVFSGWTGYTKNNGRMGELGEDGDGFHGDVHKCSSATCEVCEQRRQQGIQFVPTRSPPRPQLPSDSSREYVADDTVEL